MTPNRMFNPRTGRWSQPDPLFWGPRNIQGSRNVMAQAGNLYMFTMHDPVNFTDPSGLVAVPFLIPPAVKFALWVVALLTAATATYTYSVTVVPAINDAVNNRPITTTPPRVSTGNTPPTQATPQTTTPAQGVPAQPTVRPSIESIPANTIPTNSVNFFNGNPVNPSALQGRDTVVSNQGQTICIRPSANHRVHVGTHNTPLQGTANSSIDIVDSSGDVHIRRWFDGNGQHARDVHFTNHGNPVRHPEVPHNQGQYTNVKT